MSTHSVDRLTLTAVFEPDEGGWIRARVLEMPGANTAAPTVDEAKALLADAVRELIASYADDAESAASDEARYEKLEIVLA